MSLVECSEKMCTGFWNIPRSHSVWAQVLCNCKRVAVLLAADEAWSSEDCRLAVCNVWQELVETSQAAKSAVKSSHTKADSLDVASTKIDVAASTAATRNSSSAADWASNIVFVQSGTHEVCG